MALTIGTGPFGDQPGGVFNFSREGPDRVVYWEAYPRRVRAELAGETVADSAAVRMLHETTLLPVYYFPEDDLRTDLLERSEKRTHCPYKGDTRYFSLRVGDRVSADACWTYPDPLGHAPPLAGSYAFHWEKVDRWFEEDDEIRVHPPDPYHRIDVRASSRHVRVLLDGEVLAETTRPRMLFETGLPPRFYMPLDDVRGDLLEPSDSTTRCAYKGEASYWGVRIGGTLHEDLLWCYRDPEPEGEGVRSLVAFYNEHVDLEVDGESWHRPVTKFTRRRVQGVGQDSAPPPVTPTKNRGSGAPGGIPPPGRGSR